MAVQTAKPPEKAKQAPQGNARRRTSTRGHQATIGPLADGPDSQNRTSTPTVPATLQIDQTVRRKADWDRAFGGSNEAAQESRAGVPSFLKGRDETPFPPGPGPQHNPPHEVSEVVQLKLDTAFGTQRASTVQWGRSTGEHLKALHHAAAHGTSEAGASVPSYAPIQASLGRLDTRIDVLEAAERGLQGSGGPLPHLDTIQRAFGRHDVSGIQAHFGPEATEGAQAMGAVAFATGNRVAFAGGGPDLRTAAHEAAHVVQQRGGVQLKGGVGRVGDPYEQHADAVADQVVRGQSSEALLDVFASGGASQGSALQAGSRGSVSAAGAPVQMMTDDELQTHIGKILSVKRGKFSPIVQVTNEFKKWLQKVLEKDSSEVDTWMEGTSDSEVIELIRNYKAYQAEFRKGATHKESDAEVGQGTYLVASQAEMDEGKVSGLFTTGVEACVMVAFHLENQDSPSESVFAMSHLDSTADPATVDEIYDAVIAKAGGAEMLKTIHHKITISLAGGGGEKDRSGEKGLAGPNLFEACSKKAGAILLKDPTVHVREHRSLLQETTGGRVDAKGIERLSDASATTLEAARFGYDKSKTILSPDQKESSEGVAHREKVKKRLDEADGK